MAWDSFASMDELEARALVATLGPPRAAIESSLGEVLSFEPLFAEVAARKRRAVIVNGRPGWWKGAAWLWNCVAGFGCTKMALALPVSLSWPIDLVPRSARCAACSTVLHSSWRPTRCC